MTLPFGWERRNLARHELDSLWREGQMVLRVVNQMEAQAAREGDADAATARLEAKLDLALHLLARSLQGQGPCPEAARITLWSDGCALWADPSLQPGDEVCLSLYLSPALALPLKMAASVLAISANQVEMSWIAMPEAVNEAWEQWLFRQHRRSVQEQRGQK